jgi:hypothetical protein
MCVYDSEKEIVNDRVKEERECVHERKRERARESECV